MVVHRSISAIDKAIVNFLFQNLLGPLGSVVLLELPHSLASSWALCLLVLGAIGVPALYIFVRIKVEPGP